MNTLPQRAQPDSLTQAFLKGFFAQLPLQLASWGVYVFVRDHIDSLVTFGVARVASILVLLLSSLALIAMWWGRARWRSYGVLTGFLVWPLLISGFFQAAVMMLHLIS